MRLEVVGPKNNERQCEVKVPLIKHLVNPFVINMTTVRVPPALPRPPRLATLYLVTIQRGSSLGF